MHDAVPTWPVCSTELDGTLTRDSANPAQACKLEQQAANNTCVQAERIDRLESDRSPPVGCGPHFPPFWYDLCGKPAVSAVIHHATHHGYEHSIPKELTQILQTDAVELWCRFKTPSSECMSVGRRKAGIFALINFLHQQIDQDAQQNETQSRHGTSSSCRFSAIE